MLNFDNIGNVQCSGALSETGGGALVEVFKRKSRLTVCSFLWPIYTIAQDIA